MSFATNPLIRWGIDFSRATKFITNSLQQWRLYVAAVLLLAISATAVGWTIWQLRTDSIRSAVSDSGNIASVLSSQLARALDSIDSALLDIQASITKLEVEENTDLARTLDENSLRNLLMQYHARTPWIFNIVIADHNGNVIVSTASHPAPAINVSDRDYFTEAKSGLRNELVASIPVNNRINGTRAIVFSRRLEGKGGTFLGIIYASVNTAYFENIYESVKSINALLFTLVRRDGTILFRSPDSRGTSGRKLSAETAWLESLSNGNNGFRVLALADGNVRFVSSREVPQYPLFVNISVTEDAALAGWRKRSTTIGIGSALLFFCSIALLIAFNKQVRRLGKSEDELVQLAHYDALTLLSNRSLFSSNVEEAVSKFRRYGTQFCIFMLDLDRFKIVNDSLGHAVGDLLLKAVGARLQTLIGTDDAAARLGGDEFAILHPIPANERDHVFSLAENVLAEMVKPYDLEGRILTIGVSIGIAFVESHESDADTIMRNADLALYKCKAEGRNRYRVFDRDMEASARERRELENDLSSAITRREFELHYQPIVNLSNGKCVGAEALVRWRHPSRGLIYPDQFIQLAEESGLIVPLGEMILRQACSDAAKWPPNIKLAVNLSAAQFRQGNLTESVRSALADEALASTRLELEITETVLLDPDEKNLATLHDLRELGISIALDDFGTGYSSMRYLQIFRFDKIKIDKSFVQSMEKREDSAAIICAIVSLARTLEMETVAEGVETMEQATLLRAAGCELAQGYLFGRPVSLKEATFQRVLEDNKNVA